MKKRLLVFSLLAIVLLAGCTKGTVPTTNAPAISSENVEAASSSTETAANNFVNDATPTNDQVVPDLTP